MERKINLKTAIYGVVVGDALGLPVQFMERGSYKKVTGMLGHMTFDLPEGSWSDDSSLTLATCDSIRRMGKVDIEDIRSRFEDWLFDGKYTPYGFSYDIGRTCYRAITGGKGCTENSSNGNGSLMRIMPLAFVEGITDDEIMEVSAITHAHKVSKTGCVSYIRIAQDLMKGIDLKESIKNRIDPEGPFKRCIGIEELGIDEIRSTGYIVDSLEAALWCLLTTDSYESCLIKAVNLGHDTDSIGAIAGGLAAIKYGYDSIPADWIEAIKNKLVINSSLF